MEESEKAVPEVIDRTYSETEVKDHCIKAGGNRNVKEIVITDDEGKKYAYLVKRPTRAVVEASMVATKNGEIVKMNKLAIGCVLAGNMDVIDQDGQMFAELAARISQIGNKITSEIKNF
jgi:hypothetical protein